MVPIDDKSIGRGYSLKEEFLVNDNQIFQVKQKVQRLLDEGKKINLVGKFTQDDIINIIKQLLHTAKQLYGHLKGTKKLQILLTGGSGDFTILLNAEPRPQVIPEMSITQSYYQSLDLNVKSNNYLVRTYMASESRSRGGYIAIEQDKEGYLLEGSMATVAVLLKNGDFIIPPFERILSGTTAIKIMDFLEKEVIPNSDRYFDGNENYIKKIVRREILVQECKDQGVEAMFLGGEECVPLLEWDGHILGEEKGPAATLFQEYLRSFLQKEELELDEGRRILVDYDNYQI
ncbi:branched-chain-amino-acid aminotransferase-like protein chloroplastic-like [Stylonychia lemnae]|uniref:Branched-chain-amino-acid aminotransferase-like protein chloroplastic-like n=1 Tax=Stylonychia lemnae TaxID=5949 RepID=A0A078A674_STYLE|nr:branched-chain-amino-acid aminotransferase-like protein chloroplastic-like [Stylonychia lemnae]|eukprot:CDW77371.1 branched-chain-amino-acid aminotransferase-like protein chloroplastic-like [Stylonychia lemnae]